MTFTTGDNPYARQPSTRHVPQTYEAEGRRFVSTGEYRPAKKGEYVLGLFGVAQAKRDLDYAMEILREVKP